MEKLFVVQNNDSRYKRDSDKDLIYNLEISFTLYCSEPIIELKKKWWEALYYCQCELEAWHAEEVYTIWLGESTTTFNDSGRFVDHDVIHYPLIKGVIVNQFRSQRICDILNWSLGYKKYYFERPESGIISEYGGDMYDKKLFPADLGCPYAIDLIKNSNLKYLEIPTYISKTRWNFNIYLCLGRREGIADEVGIGNSSDNIIFSNVENLYDIIPNCLRYEVFNQLSLYVVPGQQIQNFIDQLNTEVETHKTKYPPIKFHVGNRLFCKYETPVNLFNEEYRMWKALKIHIMPPLENK